VAQIKLQSSDSAAELLLPSPAMAQYTNLMKGEDRCANAKKGSGGGTSGGGGSTSGGGSGGKNPTALSPPTSTSRANGIPLSSSAHRATRFTFPLSTNTTTDVNVDVVGSTFGSVPSPGGRVKSHGGHGAFDMDSDDDDDDNDDGDDNDAMQDFGEIVRTTPDGFVVVMEVRHAFCCLKPH